MFGQLDLGDTLLFFRWTGVIAIGAMESGAPEDNGGDEISIEGIWRMIGETADIEYSVDDHRHENEPEHPDALFAVDVVVFEPKVFMPFEPQGMIDQQHDTIDHDINQGEEKDDVPTGEEIEQRQQQREVLQEDLALVGVLAVAYDVAHQV